MVVPKEVQSQLDLIDLTKKPTTKQKIKFWLIYFIECL